MISFNVLQASASSKMMFFSFKYLDIMLINCIILLALAKLSLLVAILLKSSSFTEPSLDKLSYNFGVSASFEKVENSNLPFETSIKNVYYIFTKEI